MSATSTRPEARISIDHSRSPALPAEAGRSKGWNAAIAAPLIRFAHWTVLAWGWQRAAIAFLAGAVSVLALAPFNLWPVMFLTFPVVVWLIDGSAAGRLSGVLTAAGAGWWFGFGYFLAGLYWVGYAFLVDAETFGWLLPVAVAGLPAGLALFTALGFALARLMWTRGPIRVLALALALTAAEWLRGHALSGFPWNAYGYALTGPLALAQGAALVGLWGLTFVAVAVFASPAVLVDERSETRRPWAWPLAAVLVLAALATYGAIRLAQSPTELVEGVRLRLMQPNLQQDEKFNYGAKQQVMQRYLALSDRATGPDAMGVRDVTHLIWPESAFPFFIAREADALAQIAALLPPGTTLITGGVRPEETTPGARIAHVYNSIYVIDHDGSTLGVYDKNHLVPFGEYLPFQELLESFGLMQLTKVQGGFIAGDRRRLLAVPRAPPALPLICYEVIFPGEVASRSGERAGWMINLTNDGWFGNSTGPYQHLQQARVRAIEEGLPLVRAANTGISAVIDPLGRIIRQLPLGQEGVLDAGLPRPVEPTWFVRLGDSVAALMLAGAAILVIRRRLRWTTRAR
ncbi:MAG TPA: apolipoprotein N-acyltransferase [Xanthobacteraceae bacterium]|nr:apolipoprotein N-acyltransferase [Xanthobacteraceae bacterium]